MKKDKIVYWSSTAIISVMMLFSAYLYLSQNPDLIANFKVLGYPVYFILLLGAAKLLGAIALIVPGFEKIKEWAYAGFTFTFTGAVWSHISTGTSFAGPLIFLVVLIVSYWFKSRINAQKA